MITQLENSQQIQLLIDYYSSLPERFDLFFSVEKGTFVTGSIKHVFDALKLIKTDLHLISEKDIFLDAGSGDGRVCALAALLGMRSFGIEYHEQIVSASIENIDILNEKGLFESNRISIPVLVQGDFLDDNSFEKLGIKFEEISVFFNFVTYHEDLCAKILEQSPKGTKLILHSPCPTSFRPRDFELLKEIPLEGIYQVMYVFQKS